jgi:hypothetical protein
VSFVLEGYVDLPEHKGDGGFDHAAVRDPGLVEVFGVHRLERANVVLTERGAHKIALDLDRHRLHAFLPTTHRPAAFAASR